MRIYYHFVYIVLNVILLISKIDCQVVLTRQLLEQCYCNDLTNLETLRLLLLNLEFENNKINFIFHSGTKV